MVHQVAKTPAARKPKTPVVAPQSTDRPGAGAADRLRQLSYAQARAAVAPGGRRGIAPAAATDYAASRATVSPNAKTAVAAVADPVVAAKTRAAAARENYQTLLGAALGGKLYDVVAKALAPEQILALGGKGLDAAAQAGVAAIHPVQGVAIIDEASEAEAVRQLAGALTAWANAEAQAWLQSDDGRAFAARINQRFEGSPAAVVVLALLAAAGAVAANASIPELKQKFQLGAHTALNAGVDLNTLRDIAVRSAHLGVEWKKGDVEASLTYSYQKGASGQPAKRTMNAKIGDTHKSLTADATVQGDKLVLDTAGTYASNGLQVAAGVHQSRESGGKATTLADAKVAVGGETKNVTADAIYDASTGDLAIGLDAVQKLGGSLTVTQGVRETRKAGVVSHAETFGAALVGADASADVQVSRDSATGRVAASVKGSKKVAAGQVVGEAHGSASYDSATGASVGAGTTLQTPHDLKITLDAMLREHGASTASASVEKKWGDLSAKGAATYDLTDHKLQQLALEFGFHDKDSFNAFLVDYKRSYDGDMPHQQLDLLVQAQLGQLMVRGTSKTAFERDRVAGNVTGIEAAHPLTPDLTVIGGAHYGVDDRQHPGLNDKERGMWLEAGVQVKGVPVVVSYRPEDKAVTVGITIPFGK